MFEDFMDWMVDHTIVPFLNWWDRAVAPNWNYLIYVLRHKYYVYKGGRHLGLGHWQLLKHDLSKFSRIEWKPYVDNFYRPGDSEVESDEFRRAWLHHIHHNPHHWQHYVLNEDSGDTHILRIPDIYRREMLADWYGAGMAITLNNDVAEWYQKNKDRMMLHPGTRAWVERKLELIKWL